MDETNRRIAADLLLEMIRSKQIRLGNATGRNEPAIEDAVTCFHALLEGISRESKTENCSGPM